MSSFKNFKSKNELPERLLALDNNKRFGITISLPKVLAGAIISDFATPSQFIEYCIEQTCKAEGVVYTIDGFVSVKQQKLHDNEK